MFPRKLMILLGFVACVSMLSSICFSQSSEADFRTFRDSAHSYSLRYPKSWVTVDPSHAATRFKAVSEGGYGAADLSLNVINAPEMKGKRPEAYYQGTKNDPMMIVRLMSQQYPDIRLIGHGETKISNLPAYYLEAGFSYQGARG